MVQSAEDAEILDRNFGPEFWTGILDRNFGPEFWTGILDRNFGPEFWTGILDRNFGPEFSARIFGNVIPKISGMSFPGQNFGNVIPGLAGVFWECGCDRLTRNSGSYKPWPAIAGRGQPCPANMAMSGKLARLC